MEERLRKLKSSMKKTVFSELTFTENHKKLVKNKIAAIQVKPEEEIVLAILHLLTVEVTGFELNKKIRARGIQNFEENEGQLYMLLHKLEQKGYLHSYWTESEEKHYRTTNKGSKLLTLADKKRTSTKSIFKELLEG